jgi:hypothetical protein
MDESTIIANDIADLIKKFDNKKEWYLWEK